MVEKKRVDDAFLRRVAGALLIAAIASAGGWIWTLAYLQSQVNTNTAGVEEIRALQRTMNHINEGVVTLVENSRIRNELMQKYSDRQDYIFGEQKRRTSTIKRSNEHMDNRSIHK